MIVIRHRPEGNNDTVDTVLVPETPLTDWEPDGEGGLWLDAWPDGETHVTIKLSPADAVLLKEALQEHQHNEARSH